MSTSVPSAGRPAFFSVQQTAWFLGVPIGDVWRAIRRGTLRATPRRSGLAVSSVEVVRLLGGGR